MSKTTETAPCAVCGFETRCIGASTRYLRCNGCWEVERNIDDYLKSAQGREFISEKLKEAEEKYHD